MHQVRDIAWHELPDYEPHGCEFCDIRIEKLAHARDHLHGLLAMIYSRDAFDSKDFEWHLEEIASALWVPIPVGPPQIERSHIWDQIRAAEYLQKMHENFFAPRPI